MHLIRTLSACLVLTSAACGQGEGAPEQRGPLPSVEGHGGEGGTRSPPGVRPRADSESVLGANADRVPGGTAACEALVDPHGSPPVPVQQLVATIHGTEKNPGIRGEVRFVANESGVHVQSRVQGLPAGTHAHHVHLFGDCTDPGTTAGPHFDIEGTEAAGGPARILGDLGDLQAAKGDATSERPLQNVKLTGGPDTLLGRSVVIHAGPNDPTKAPDGGAGDPIACGVIGIVGTGSASAGLPADTLPGGAPPLDRPPGTTQAAPSPTPGQAANDNPGQIRAPEAPASAPRPVPAPAPAPASAPSGR